DIGAFEWSGGPLDQQAPTQPDGLLMTASTQTQLRVGWHASWDANGVGGYAVSVDGAPVDSLAGGATTDSVGHLACGTTYSVGVAAIDVAGNVSLPTVAALTTRRCR